MSRPLARSCSVLTLCTTLAAACASPGVHPNPNPAPATMDSAAASAKKGANSWSPERVPGSWRYELRSEGVVALTADTASERVPVRSTTLYTLTLTAAPGDRLGVTGRVDSVAVVTNSQVPPRQPADTVRPEFSGELLRDGTLLSLAGSRAARCGAGTDPLVAAVHALFVRTPSPLTIGAEWRDTTTTVTCRGEMPIATTTVRSYRVVATTTRNGQPALEIERKGTISLANAPEPPGARSRMSITGAGTSTALLTIDPTTGLLLGSSGESHATFTVTTGQSTLPFRQDATETVALLR